ncbi:mosc domain-containing protein [Purpureocillium lilacinum]|uniref:Mosc domain-containing protein n=1 Tax=Purpureocillium lilacinum TaxID=33203 RepID=A0A179GXM7_PURLI|nr:mosc domain-containing protein [Purpureocillium lilacinum]
MSTLSGSRATGDAVLSAAVLVTAVTILLVWMSSRPHNGDTLEISQLYVYPVKSLRGSPLKEAHVGQYGMIGDRTFALQRVHRDENNKVTRYETVLAGYYLQVALFRARVEHGGKLENAPGGEVIVTWHGRDTEFDTTNGIETDDEIRFPLYPSVEELEQVEVSLHTSAASAYDMGNKYATWFTDRLGMEIRLAFIGNGSRPVLGSHAPNSKSGLIKGRLVRRLRGMVPGLALPAERLAFNDIAHYLVVTEESNNQVTSRLAVGCEMDVTKFRPNIVVKGASGPFVEDYWGELTFEGGIQMPLTANCYRCQSIIVDYDTGKTATDDSGMVWKKLNKDRRVDKGAKYSPVFGRYGYCFGSSNGKRIFLGQKAKVTYINKERTTFDWPHLTSFGVTQQKK